MAPVNLNDLLTILPAVFIVVWACVLLLVDAFAGALGKRLTPWLTALGLVVALVLDVSAAGVQASAFNGMLEVDGFSHAINVLVLGAGLLSFFVSYDYLNRQGIAKGEYYILMLFSISGMMLMGAAADLIVVFLAVELLSIPLYILAAFAQPEPKSEEAGLKYFLLGAFAGGFLLYGVALVYGATASTRLSEIVAAVAAGLENPIFLLLGAALILIGLGFKVAAVPFHMWTPDVYEGAPSSVTAFMAVGAKVGGFAALLRVFIVAFPSLGVDLAPVLTGVVAATLIVGNVAAIAQRNIKRLLAYSSISHAGFILMAIVPYADDAVHRDTAAAALFYLLAFALTSFGAWAVVMTLERAEGKGLELSDYAGLFRKYPALALAMLVFMLSFAGVPPTLGFAGKFFLFRAVLEGGYVGLAVLGVLTSLVSAYYYLRVVVIMFMEEGKPQAAGSPLLNLTTGLTALGTVGLFFFSQPLLDWATNALLRLF
ncbi:MAG: NADH-quinone oxidoreductase subunit N [Anaerolineae bacterium]|nr:MAG: NADH-quinone oxidoreductase subunit N [Anaerolineae bacterium]